MGLTKSGSIQYRSKTSHCQKCEWYIKDYECWKYDYIPYMIFGNCIGYECEYFDSILKDQCNNCYVFRDYEDKDLFPEKVFGQSKYRFNSKGERI